MYFKQIVKEDLGCAGYIIGCPSAGVCALIDPRVDMVEEMLTLVAKKGMQVTKVIETHIHADHLSGHEQVARRTGATICIHEHADVMYPHHALKDEDELEFGVVRIRVMHTPGHRPEHIALVVADTARSDAPWFVLTGDSLFIGDVARPDLAVSGEEGATALYHSIFHRLFALEDGVEVYPAHVAGSLCGRGMSEKTSSTIGFERKYNPATEARPLATFVADLNKDLPQRPPNMSNIVKRNRQGFTHEPASIIPQNLDVQTFHEEMERGGQILDIRSPQDFATGHIRGAIHVFLHGSAFATRVGFVTAPGQRLLLIADNEQDVHTASTQLEVIGIEHIAGYLNDGIEDWREHHLPLQQVRQLSVEELHAQRNSLAIVDVRDQSEWDEEHIREAIHIPYNTLEQNLGRLGNKFPIALMCASGQRSMLACSLLQKHNLTDLFNVIGGIEAWKQAGFETEGSRDASL